MMQLLNACCVSSTVRGSSRLRSGNSAAALKTDPRNARSDCNDTVGKGLRQLAKRPASVVSRQHDFWHEACILGNSVREHGLTTRLANFLTPIANGPTSVSLNPRDPRMADHPTQPSNSLTVWVFGGMTLFAGSLTALSSTCQQGYQRGSDFAQAVPIHPSVIEQRTILAKKRESKIAAQSLATATIISERHPTRTAGLGLSPISLAEGVLVPLTRIPFPLAAVHAFHRFALPIATSVFLVTFGIWSLTSIENRALSIVEPST